MKNIEKNSEKKLIDFWKKKDEKRNPKTEKNFGKRNLEEKTGKNRWKNCKIIYEKYWKNFGKRLEKFS